MPIGPFGVRGNRRNFESSLALCEWGSLGVSMANIDRVVLPADRLPAILVIDDEILIRLALAEFLQDCGFRVFEANNAAEALVALSSADFEVDVVLTDLCMPGDVDGFGLAHWIKDNRPDLPVLITTGDIAKAQTAHDLCEKNAIIPKPHDLPYLLARIRSAMTAAKSLPEQRQAP